MKANKDSKHHHDQNLEDVKETNYLLRLSSDLKGIKEDERNMVTQTLVYDRTWENLLL